MWWWNELAREADEMKQLRALQMLSCALILGACTLSSDNDGPSDNEGDGGAGQTSDDDGSVAPGGQGGSGGATGGSGGTATTTGGSGGTASGVGGTGGKGDIDCTQASECPAASDQCSTAVCEAGQCGFDVAVAETSCSLPQQQTGLCDGSGTCGQCVPNSFHCQNADTVESCGADWFWSGNGTVCAAICAAGACMPASGIAAGAHHTCAWFPDGHVRCWGRNDSGQLGDGTTSAQGVDPPVVVTNLFDIESVHLGGHSSFALDDDNKVLAWGDNSSGQLGLGHSLPQITPEDVWSAHGATTIAVGDSAVCVVMGDTTVKCWGDNSDGLLGTTDSATTVTTPSLLPNLTNVADVAVGSAHRCVLFNDQTVACWGANVVGQLGQGIANPGTATPTAVVGLANVVSIDIGASGKHTCAALSDGSVSCWGDNTSGQLGQAGFGGFNATPTPTALSFSGAYEVVLGSHHSCIRSNVSANAYCWGENSSGQLGQGHNGDVADAQGLSQQGIVSLALGGGDGASSGHTCTLHSGGSIACAGDNSWRQLSDGAYTGAMSNVFHNTSFWHEDFLNP
jgi:alpha-tubulin suppressor-like RCC1 family protein